MSAIAPQSADKRTRVPQHPTHPFYGYTASAWPLSQPFTRPLAGPRGSAEGVPWPAAPAEAA
jgi:hypothetical protein